MSDRVFRLLERHQKLDEALRLAQRRRLADPFEIVRLKKLKLAIKDRLTRSRARRSWISRSRRKAKSAMRALLVASFLNEGAVAGAVR